jgi:hypothetical protein
VHYKYRLAAKSTRCEAATIDAAISTLALSRGAHAHDAVGSSAMFGRSR